MRDGGRGCCDSLVWETTGPKIKGNSLIIYLLPATVTRLDRPLKTGGFDGNEISFSGVLCPASGLSDLTHRLWAGTPEDDSESRAGSSTEGLKESREEKMSNQGEVIDRWLIVFVCSTAQSPAVMRIWNQLDVSAKDQFGHLLYRSSLIPTQCLIDSLIRNV